MAFTRSPVRSRSGPPAFAPVSMRRLSRRSGVAAEADFQLSRTSEELRLGKPADFRKTVVPNRETAKAECIQSKNLPLVSVTNAAEILTCRRPIPNAIGLQVDPLRL